MALNGTGRWGCPGRSHDNEGQAVQTAPRPAAVSTLVSRVPSVTRKNVGNFASHGAFAAGQYWRALASIAVTPGTWAARPAEWISDAPGQVRSCTHRNIPYFCAAAARRS